MEEFVEVIGVEHLKTVLSGLTPEEIVKPAYDNWMGGIKTGHTVLNLETGNVYGLGIDFNQLPLADEIYIELFTKNSFVSVLSSFTQRHSTISLKLFSVPLWYLTVAYPQKSRLT